MSVLRSIESRIEGLFEGIFGRAFRTHVQPIELARKLVKEMDDHRSVSVSRVYVPNEYTVYLSPPDRKQFAGYEGSLVGELQEYLAEHARREQYELLTPPHVLITEDGDLAVGEFGIATRMVPASEDAALLPETPRERPAETMIYRAPAPVPAPVPPPVPPPVPVAATDPEPEPEPEPPREIFTLSVDRKVHEVLKERVVLGRSRDADVRIADLNVSRKHAEVQQRGDEYVLVDLGSTNGTLLNGKRVERAKLNEGDVITLGSTDVVVGRSRT
jgi:hypothetical protein